MREDVKSRRAASGTGDATFDFVGGSRAGVSHWRTVKMRSVHAMLQRLGRNKVSTRKSARFDETTVAPNCIDLQASRRYSINAGREGEVRCRAHGDSGRVRAGAEAADESFVDVDLLGTDSEQRKDVECTRAL